MGDEELKLEVVKASFQPDFDVDDTTTCEIELRNISFEQYRKLLTFIDTI